MLHGALAVRSMIRYETHNDSAHAGCLGCCFLIDRRPQRRHRLSAFDLLRSRQQSMVCIGGAMRCQSRRLVQRETSGVPLSVPIVTRAVSGRQRNATAWPSCVRKSAAAARCKSLAARSDTEVVWIRGREVIADCCLLTTPFLGPVFHRLPVPPPGTGTRHITMSRPHMLACMTLKLMARSCPPRKTRR